MFIKSPLIYLRKKLFNKKSEIYLKRLKELTEKSDFDMKDFKEWESKYSELLEIYFNKKK